MQDYIFFFRWMQDLQPSPEEMQAAHKDWMNWIETIIARNQLAGPGNSLAASGKVIRANGVVTDGPYVEIKEALGGFITVRVNTMEEAVELAQACPVVKGGGSLEIRPVAGGPAK
ncbi:transcription initiation protein [Pseudoflavitalea sp. G-6-1-2]|uniref:YciI family protein n=1 Tax=Pseudoflavitalea sp. G-6-1-2 TaxID=2728841 RepID=UPI00146C2922|nr:YciI family protein [Pseudoflavitalea sp. G-6-1-2]NML21159.1 transcription initiation protein [Pseudoflavitalea sp. G-6-1-2]